MWTVQILLLLLLLLPWISVKLELLQSALLRPKQPGVAAAAK
jgi:hypothetical protein